MNFTFIHAADLHIDSPLAALGAKDKDVAARFDGAVRQAFENLRDEAVRSGAAFLLIAGDVFDGTWKDMTTGQYFARILGELSRAGIKVFIAKGNHDAQSVVVRDLPLPGGVTVFGAQEAETVTIEHLGVAIHGRSFPDRNVPADFAGNYPMRIKNFLNIGMLHTSLGGSAEHDEYAPCSVDDLRRFEYDYWALGHIHEHRIVSGGDPWIVYPGNIQGRSVRETGAKGAVRVSVKDGRIDSVEHIALDAARWAHSRVDVEGLATLEEVHKRIDEALADAQAQAADLPLAIRLTLHGQTTLHETLMAGLCDLEDVRAIASRHGSYCWVEKIRIETVAPAIDRILTADDALDIRALIEAASNDPELKDFLQKTVAAIAEKLPKTLATDFIREAGASPGLGDSARDFLLGAFAMERSL